MAGDLLIGDARLLHAAHPNRSTERHTCLTLWHYPRYDEMSESSKAALRVPPLPEGKGSVLPSSAFVPLRRESPWNPGVYLRP